MYHLINLRKKPVMKLSQVGAQLYTVRDHLKDPGTFARTIDRLKSFGYRAVELIHSDTVNDQQIAEICGAAEMAVAAAHIPGEIILERPDLVVEKLKTVRAKIGVYAFPHGVDFSSRVELERLAEKLEKSARVLAKEGLTLAYHNHAMEFARLDKELVLDLIRSAAPGLSFELDAYWAQYGGVNPERWVRKFGNKLVALHLKDFGVAAKHGEPPFMTEVGRGNLDFKTLIGAAEDGGCQWFIVEQDFTSGDPFDSLEHSFRYVRAELVEPESGH
jgi:sugar phosphate isomerase/epimerase